MLAWNLAFSLVCFASTLVLPGFGILYLARQTGLARRLARGTEAASPQVIFCRAIALSTFCVAAIGYLLLALRWFTAGRLALCMLPVGLCGVHLAVQTARPLVRNWRVAAVVGILAVPYAGPVLSGGHSPANNFNWYYWLLGRDLSAAHGVPGWAPEYGIHLRWQPDYLSFSLLTECFRGFSVGVSDATVLDMWKVP
ncbi:MAG: hypothetical protein ABIR57_11270, partial [Aeromicrobium sp.]